MTKAKRARGRIVDVPSLRQMQDHVDVLGPRVALDILTASNRALAGSTVTSPEIGRRIALEALEKSPLCVAGHLVMARSPGTDDDKVAWLHGAHNAAQVTALICGTATDGLEPPGAGMNHLDQERAQRALAASHLALGIEMVDEGALATATVFFRPVLQMPTRETEDLREEARDRLVDALVRLRDWKGAWLASSAAVRGPGAAYGMLLAATGAGEMAEGALDTLADACLRSNRFVPDRSSVAEIRTGDSPFTDPGSRSAAVTYLSRSHRAWAVVPTVVDRLDRRQRQRTQAALSTTSGGVEALLAMPVRKVLVALRASATILGAVREDTQIGEMLLGDWVRPEDSAHLHAQVEALIVEAVGEKTADTIIAGLDTLVRWGETQRGDGATLLARYMTQRREIVRPRG